MANGRGVYRNNRMRSGTMARTSRSNRRFMQPSRRNSGYQRGGGVRTSVRTGLYGRRARRMSNVRRMPTTGRMTGGRRMGGRRNMVSGRRNMLVNGGRVATRTNMRNGMRTRSLYHGRRNAVSGRRNQGFNV